MGPTDYAPPRRPHPRWRQVQPQRHLLGPPPRGWGPHPAAQTACAGDCETHQLTLPGSKPGREPHSWAWSTAPLSKAAQHPPGPPMHLT